MFSQQILIFSFIIIFLSWEAQSVKAKNTAMVSSSNSHMFNTFTHGIDTAMVKTLTQAVLTLGTTRTWD